MCVRVRVVVVSSERYYYVLFYFSSVDGKEEWVLRDGGWEP